MTSCPCCSSSAYLVSETIHNLPRSAQEFTKTPFIPPTLSAELYHCSFCQHSFLDIPPVGYYKSVFRSVGISPQMLAFRHNQFSEIFTTYLSSQEDVKTLEVGCGDGSLSSILSSLSFKSYATDHRSDFPPNKDIVFVDTHPDNDSFVSDLLPYAPFNYISCYSYLEHLPCPHSFFQKISQLLHPDGILHIEVPNSDFIFRHKLINEVIPDHLHYFTSLSLTHLAARSKLDLVSYTAIWHNYISSAIFKPSPSRSPVSLLSGQHRFFKNVDTFIHKYSDKHIVVWGAGHQALLYIS